MLPDDAAPQVGGSSGICVAQGAGNGGRWHYGQTVWPMGSTEDFSGRRMPQPTLRASPALERNRVAIRRLVRGETTGRDERIRTSDPHTPSVMRYQAALRPETSGAAPIGWRPEAGKTCLLAIALTRDADLPPRPPTPPHRRRGDMGWGGGGGGGGGGAPPGGRGPRGGGGLRHRRWHENKGALLQACIAASRAVLNGRGARLAPKSRDLTGLIA